MRLVIYDVESYPNFFSVDFCDFNTGKHKYFEISAFRNDRKELLKSCHKMIEHRVFLLGVNNIKYDIFLIEKFLRNPKVSSYELYELTVQIIENQDLDDNRFYIKPKNRTIKQIDLFKINHYDNKARMTSLKALQFAMRYPNLQDLPFPPGTWLTEEQAEVIRRYNPNDTDSTREFCKYNIEAIEFRAELKRKYPYQDWYNFADTKIGKEYFVMMLEKASVECYDYEVEGAYRQPKQTHREVIDLNDAILHWLQFKTPEFQNVVDWLVRQRISETKSVFSKKENYNYNSENELIKQIPKTFMHGDEKIKNKIVKTIKLPEHPSKYRHEYIDGSYSIVQEPLNAKVNGFQFDFGTGGIHGSVTREVIESCDEYTIFDIDVKSYYPNLAISNRFHPEHLGEKFCDVYQELYEERSKHPKGSAINKMLKLALNGVYGESNSKFSVFYDPLFTMKITLNGQLLLCLLTEMIWEKLADAKLIQINTDGLTVKIKRTESEILHQVVRAWEQITRLEMEFVEYTKMIVRDVNNYIAVDVDGNVKRKGDYEYKLEWHKNHSSLVIPKVTEKVLLEGADPIELLESWPDPMDFMIKAKVQRTGKFILQVQEDKYEEIQKTSRVYVSNDGCEMFKLLPPIEGKPEPKKGFFKYENENWRKIAFMKGRKISVANDLSDVNLDEIQIDYDFYLDEINKLTNGLTKEVIHEC